jgi:hypothetical protein
MDLWVAEEAIAMPHLMSNEPRSIRRHNLIPLCSPRLRGAISALSLTQSRGGAEERRNGRRPGLTVAVSAAPREDRALADRASPMLRRASEPPVARGGPAA